MGDKAEILVFGATGQQGGAVARAVRQQGRQVRAFVRDPDSGKAKALAAAGITLAVGDLFDRASIDKAMKGVQAVFSVQTSSPAGEVSDDQEVQQGKAIADSAVAHGVSHLVYSSGGAAGKGPTGMGHFESKSEIEAYVRSLPIQSTITRPASFMEMMMLPGMGLDRTEFTYFMQPGQAMQMITLEDLGRINASILADPARYAGRAIEIASAAITGEDLERAFSAAAGRPIRYLRFPEAVLSGSAFLARLVELVDDGLLAGQADIPALEAEFGPMMTLEAWLAGPGKPLFDAALALREAEVALR